MEEEKRKKAMKLTMIASMVLKRRLEIFEMSYVEAVSEALI